MRWLIIVTAFLLASCGFPMPINPSHAYHPVGWTPSQYAIISDALATLSVRASVAFVVSDEGLPIVAEAPDPGLDGLYDYVSGRIVIRPSAEGRWLWLVTLHEVLHSVGLGHQPNSPPRLMSARIDAERVGDVPTEQDLEDLRTALKKPVLFNCLLFYQE